MNSPSSIQSASHNLHQKTIKTIYLVIAIIVISIGINILIQFLTHNNIRRLHQLQTQAIKSKDTAISNQYLLQFIAENEQQLPIIDQALPDQNTIFVFAEAVNQLIATYDPAGRIDFSTTSPIKVDNQLTVPIIIKLNSTPYELISLLRQIERLPYLIEITSINGSFPDGITNQAPIILGGRVYVAEPFN